MPFFYDALYFLKLFVQSRSGATVVVIIWYLELQTPMQSVPITIKFVSSNPAYGKVYSMKLYVIKFLSHLQQVLRFPPPIKLTAMI